MKRFSVLTFIAALAASCSSVDSDQPVYSPRNDGGSFVSNRPAAGGLDMLPPADWWRQPLLAAAVKLTADQMSALDKIATGQGDDSSRLERDMGVAVRDLRTLLNSSQPSQNDIISAGQRLSALRDSLFDHQLQMLAAERAVLSLDQWQTLQDQLQERRQQRNQNHGYPRRGGMGGRGRWPGY
jgi:Spy/CpxP family protein refolding chaperone